MTPYTQLSALEADRIADLTDPQGHHTRTQNRGTTAPGSAAGAGEPGAWVRPWSGAYRPGARRLLMVNAGMTVRLTGRRRFALCIPVATMRAGYPGWEPHLSARDIAYIAGDSGSTVEVEFTDDDPAAPAA